MIRMVTLCKQLTQFSLSERYVILSRQINKESWQVSHIIYDKLYRLKIPDTHIVTMQIDEDEEVIYTLQCNLLNLRDTCPPRLTSFLSKEQMVDFANDCARQAKEYASDAASDAASRAASRASYAASDASDAASYAASDAASYASYAASYASDAASYAASDAASRASDASDAEIKRQIIYLKEKSILNIEWLGEDE